MRLRLLLETVAHTLQSLYLQGCRMEDSQLTVLTPALSRCSWFTKVNLCDNDFSVPILMELLLHTANWSKMNKSSNPHLWRSALTAASGVDEYGATLLYPYHHKIHGPFMMSLQTLPTLLKQARQALLRNEELAISAVEQLPMELFTAVFQDAFKGRHTRMVKAMVAAWPFPCLPVGTLMKTSNLETFQAVLEGVDMQLARNFHPRRNKMKVLDLRKLRHDFWTIWTGREDGDCSLESGDEEQVVKVLPRYAVRRRLKVIADLCLRRGLDEEEAYFLQWALERKGSLQLCCAKMKIWDMPLSNVKEILSVFQPWPVEELELTEFDLYTLTWFATYLGHMGSLRKLSMTDLYENTIGPGNRTAKSEMDCVRKFMSQFSRLHCLQHLSLKGVFFLRNQVKKLLRCLRSPLESFSISGYFMSESDMNSISRCEHLCELKHLAMRGVGLLAADSMPLQNLLETVAHTLQSLDLQGCGMEDSPLTDLIPALSRCTQLNKVNLSDNKFSVPILKDLLLHTANWSKMNAEQYPAPVECYDDFGFIDTERFLQLCPELMDALRAQRQPKSIIFATKPCSQCGMRCVYDLGPRLCPCWQ
ncbi:PRAME family member 8-like [Cricetulus griseus]|uniref:PRAME family member 8-like n=1 Tax=Cricetulus griseus TaxID=10029 RepID=A0A9J7KFK0_CRIGR|nr:PRAME family member 8-like [Cricetulus griseus]